MPWQCPACHLPIHHSEIAMRPRAGVVYRCHICRLELVLDPKEDRLTVAPLGLRRLIIERRANW
jgi:hypothetical protein